MGALRTAMWPTKAILLATSILFASNVSGDDCDKDTFRLGQQRDADALSDCPTLTGDVIVAATAQGSIDLQGVETIQGGISNENCFDGVTDRDSNQALLEGNFEKWEGCRGLESFSAQDLVHVTGDVSFQSQLDITNLDFRNLEAINGTLSVEYLPHLERMNLSRLEMVESIFFRHDRQLFNLTMSDVKNVSGENPIIEMVDLGIYEWPKIKVRHHYWDETPRRRLERLLVKDIPNVSLFELNNADEIDLLEVHGLPNQTASLQTDFQPYGPTPSDPYTDPIVLVHNFTMVGFGGDFTINFIRYTPSDVTIDVRNLHFVNNTMETMWLWRFGKKVETMYIADNSELTYLSMPQNMESAKWEAVEFRNNPRLSFGGGENVLGAENLTDWDWNFEASTVRIEGSPVFPDWVEYGMTGRVTQNLVINPSGNSSEVCEFVQENVKEGEFSAPEEGYTCGGESYDSASAAFQRADSLSALGGVVCVAGLVGAGWSF